MATIRERTKTDGESAWQAIVRVKGRPAEVRTFSRKTDAKDWARQTEADIKRGLYLPTREEQSRTLGELIDRYLGDVTARRPEKAQAKDRTYLGWWRDRLGEYRLVDVTAPRIRETWDRMERGDTPSGKPASPGTMNRYLQALSHVFSTARREYEWTRTNPVANLRRAKEPRGRDRFLSEQERERLLQECAGEPDLLDLVTLALHTGGREGEILGVRWSDVDLDRGRLVFRDTKNGTHRAAPLTGRAVEVLRERLRTRRRVGSDFVFPSRDGHRHRSFPRRQWNEAVDRAGLEGFRFHDLRHTAASYLAMSGATLAEIAEILGHKTLAMVQRYSHLTEAHTAGVVERMAERFLG